MLAVKKMTQFFLRGIRSITKWTKLIYQRVSTVEEIKKYRLYIF